MTMHGISVTYTGGLDLELDDKLTEAAGTERTSSGCAIFGNCARDIQFEYVATSDMVAAGKRLQELQKMEPRITDIAAY